MDHYAADCPEKARRKKRSDGDDGNGDNNEPKWATIDQYLEEPVGEEKLKKSVKKKKKVVTF